MLERVNRTVKLLKSLDLETLESLKWIGFFAIAIIMFGVYWYLGLKKLGTALLLVTVVFLAIIMILERQKAPIKPRTPKKRKKEDEYGFGF